MDNHIEQFQKVIQASGLIPPDLIEPGKIHRFPGIGKSNGNTSGWCILFPDSTGGAFGDWSSNLKEIWQVKREQPMSAVECKAFKHQIESAMKHANTARKEQQDEAQAKASETWEAAQPAPNDHPYLKKKRIKAYGVRIHTDSRLVIPMKIEGKFQSLQFIDSNSKKMFLPGGLVANCRFVIGKISKVFCIVEGFATGASIHEATGHTVVVAFTAGNLQNIAEVVRSKFKDAKIILCADDDHKTTGNPRLTKAQEVARSIDGLIAIPTFDVDRPDDATDFNDVANLYGLEAVTKAIENASKPSFSIKSNAPSNASSYAEIKQQQLITKVKSEPYPVDVLPGTIRAAVEEVAKFVKAPLPLVASSALAALSLALQAHTDVQRDEILLGPVSLFLLTIADSGERKTQADKMFTQSIQDYQDKQAEAAKLIWKDYKANYEAWEAKRSGIKDAIRQLAKSNKPTEEKEIHLRELELEHPEPPKVPKLIREDATPEGLAKKLQKDWPSAGVISNEAGIVFGAHGMGKDSVMRNMALLNKLWDGGRYQSDRGDEERSRDVHGARLTMGLMIQESTLRAFFDQSKGLARGSGFLARFLFAWPDSTMGTRFYIEPIAGSPALSEFNYRITELLNQSVPINENGILTPPILTLTVEAKHAWITFHDAIESELITGGKFYDVRDVASKTADNAVRLAALFHIFEGRGSAIEISAFESASKIIRWHLNEARRFLGQLALPTELVDASKLNHWLVEYCQRASTHFVGKNHTLQHGPLRNRVTLDAALRELANLDRAQMVKDGKRSIIQVNPMLVRDPS
jgi:putative DNA primase/helicase